VNPIINGQWEDSTPEDVKVMKQRAHVLFNLLHGCVQRRDYSVLSPFLPAKTEYVIAVRLSPTQVRLYELYLENLKKRGALPEGEKLSAKSRLFADFVALSQICCHPLALKLAKEKVRGYFLSAFVDSLIRSTEQISEIEN
jgi:transcriptional regulator ATRX